MSATLQQSPAKLAQTETAADLSGAIEIGWLVPDEITFYKAPGGFTGLRHGEKDYSRVSLRRALPMGNPLEYISVADNENKEIGMLRAIQELSGEQLSIVTDELNCRYYCPEIADVRSVKDKLGYVYMELVLHGTGGRKPEKSCAVKDVNKNIRLLDDDRLLIFDVEGNRYLIRSLEALSPKTRKRLEPYLF